MYTLVFAVLISVTCFYFMPDGLKRNILNIFNGQPTLESRKNSRSMSCNSEEESNNKKEEDSEERSPSETNKQRKVSSPHIPKYPEENEKYPEENEKYPEENENEASGIRKRNTLKKEISSVLSKIGVNRRKVESFKLKLKDQLIEEWNEISHCKIVRGIDKEKWKGFVEHFQSSMNVTPTVLSVLQDLNFADSSQDNIKTFQCKTTEIDGSYGMVVALQNPNGKIDVAYAVYTVKMQFVGNKDSKKTNYKVYNFHKTEEGLFRQGDPLISDVLTGMSIQADQRVSMQDVEDLSQSFIIEKAMIAFYQAGTIPKVMYTDPEATELKQLT